MRYPTRRLGRLLILLGILLLAALILPKEIWPFCLGALLIAAGLALCRR
jgi:uncharacterized membrane protein HdeD (DUF308 family)